MKIVYELGIAESLKLQGYITNHQDQLKQQFPYEVYPLSDQEKKARGANPPEAVVENPQGEVVAGIYLVHGLLGVPTGSQLVINGDFRNSISNINKLLKTKDLGIDVTPSIILTKEEFAEFQKQGGYTLQKNNILDSNSRGVGTIEPQPDGGAKIISSDRALPERIIQQFDEPANKESKSGYLNKGEFSNFQLQLAARGYLLQGGQVLDPRGRSAGTVQPESSAFNPSKSIGARITTRDMVVQGLAFPSVRQESNRASV